MDGSISIIPFSCIVFSNWQNEGIVTFSNAEKAFDVLSQDPDRYCVVLINTKMNVQLAHELFEVKRSHSHLKVILVSDAKQEMDAELSSVIDSVVPTRIRKEQLFDAITELYNSTESSRKRLLLEKLNSLGVQQKVFKNFSADKLEEIVASLANLLFRHSIKKGTIKLSPIDKKILKGLVTSKGRIPSILLSRQLRIPLTTVQRHRKMLEREFLEYSYNLKISRFGLRSADIFIQVKSGYLEKIADSLLELDQVVNVIRVIGTRNIGLSAKIIFRDNLELSKFIEKVEAIEGVGEAIWMEHLQEMGRSDLPFLQIFED